MGQFSFVCDINVIFSLFFAIVIYTDVLHINPNKSRNSEVFCFHIAQRISSFSMVQKGKRRGGGSNLGVIFITSQLGLYGHGHF